MVSPLGHMKELKMQKYKPKNIIVDAIQYNSQKELDTELFDNRITRDSYGLSAHTVNGTRLLFDGDYLVRFPNGELKVYGQKEFEDKFIRVKMEDPYLY